FYQRYALLEIDFPAQKGQDIKAMLLKLPPVVVYISTVCITKHRGNILKSAQPGAISTKQQSQPNLSRFYLNALVYMGKPFF
ncbi:MAG: hypothetical protein WCQ59_07615, partial [Candidatus Cloacimonadaceae bacterium]